MNWSNPALQHVQINTPPADGTVNEQWTQKFFDGLGRVWLENRKAPSSTWIATLTQYSARGPMQYAYRPYYNTATNQQYVLFNYDPLDRPTTSFESSNQSGSWASTALPSFSYGLGAGPVFETVTTTDELGHQTIRHKDGLSTRDGVGRMVKEERFLSVSPVVTTYAYDALNRITGITDPAGNAWTYTFDSLSRRT